MHGVVASGQDVPARLRLLRDVVRPELLLVEQIEDGRIMCSPNELLVGRGEVSSKELSIQARPSATSTRVNISEGYLLSWFCTVSPASGATAAM